MRITIHSDSEKEASKRYDLGENPRNENEQMAFNTYALIRKALCRHRIPSIDKKVLASQLAVRSKRRVGEITDYRRIMSRIPKLAYAASLLILTLSVWITFYTNDPAVGVMEWENQSKTVQVGKKYTIDAPATVTLNGNNLEFLPKSTFSVVSHTVDRSTEDAVIFLERGTMKATIVRSATYSFLVRTPDADVKVLGTKFIVSVIETTP